MGINKPDIQKMVNEISDKYKVSRIPIKTTDRKCREGLAYYATYRRRVAGKIEKRNHPRYIMICDWDEIKRTGRFPTVQVAHELAHHIINMKAGSLRHTGKMYDLEDRLGLYISRKLRR